MVAGVVYVPRRGEMFTATAAGGAWLDRDGTAVALRCNVRRGARPGAGRDRLRVRAGAAEGPGRGRRRAAAARAGHPAGGSAAVDLCSVAAGRVDAYYERGLNYWDYAAGALIAREAGAVVGGLPAAPESTSMTIAAGPGLFRDADRPGQAGTGTGRAARDGVRAKI